MRSYLFLAWNYLSRHKKTTRFTLISVILAVALVVGIFSMLDSLLKFERTQILKKEGNYHILIRNPSQNEIRSIKNRLDVKNSGVLIDFGKGRLDDTVCQLGSIDSNFAANMNFVISKGNFPTKENEIVLEKWYMDKAALRIGDTISLTLSNKKRDVFQISGIINDWGVTKAVSIPFVLLNNDKMDQQAAESKQLFILFRDHVNIQNAKNDILSVLAVPEDRIGYNDGYLALLLQTKNNRVITIYGIGVLLFSLVLLTAVIMIYNTINISVMDRVRQFGLLRCLGATTIQIKRIVRWESLFLSLKAIPFGVLLGTVLSFFGNVVLKYFNSDIFGGIAIFSLSFIGITAGVFIGIMTVLFASLIPAQKAAGISPLSAISLNYDDMKSDRKKIGLLLKIFRAETAIGIYNAIQKKSTFLLMTSSIAFSIILFLGFHILVTPTFLGVNTKKMYTADISLSSDTGMERSLFNDISNLKGTKRVFGRMNCLMQATFDTSRLTDPYKEPANSWIVSYDKMQLAWAGKYLIEGICDEDTLNRKRGVIAVRKIYRDDAWMETTNFKLGDYVDIRTDFGTEKFVVLGILDSIPYATDEITIATFISTEKLFTKISKDHLYKSIDIQLNHREQENTVSQIKEQIDGTIAFHDKRQFNAEANNAFMTMAVFIYGFLGIIALISVLNIINTMNTSVTSRTKYLGILRAVGMTGKQLNRMILMQAITYTVSGCMVGCILGIFLQKRLLYILGYDWKFPVYQVLITIGICLFAAVLSAISSLKRTRIKSICETIASL